VGGIVPLILGIYLYLQTRLVYLYIVIRAMWSTVLGGECGVIWGVLVGVWLGDLGGCLGCVLGWGLGWGSCGQLVSWLADLDHL
jgi:hypothetical protein